MMGRSQTVVEMSYNTHLLAEVDKCEGGPRGIARSPIWGDGHRNAMDEYDEEDESS